MSDIEQLIPAVPRAQTVKRVGAEQQAQRGRRKLGTQGCQRIDRIRGTAAHELAVVRDQAFPVERPGEHFETRGAVNERRRAVVWHVQRHEVHSAEVQQLRGLDREADVTDVHGVERTPEDTNRALLRDGFGHLAGAVHLSGITRGYARHQSRSIFAT